VVQTWGREVDNSLIKLMGLLVVVWEGRKVEGREGGLGGGRGLVF